MYFECDVENGLLRIFPESDAVIPEISATGADGKEIILPILKRTPQMILADASELVPWSPSSPNLYRITAGGNTCRIGFVSLRTRGNDQVLLNGLQVHRTGCCRWCCRCYSCCRIGNN